MTDIATRVYNHTWKNRSESSGQCSTRISTSCSWRRRSFAGSREVRVTFGIINRSESIKLGRLIDIGELKEQLDHIRTLRLSRGESTWLRGNNVLRQAADVRARVHPVAGRLSVFRPTTWKRKATSTS
jgi:nicotinate phosphoribosyltransferase